MGDMLEVYRGLYFRIGESLELVRQLMHQRLKPGWQDREPLLVVRLVRERLLQMFSRQEVGEICSKCRGSCCHNLFTRLHWKELFYYLGLDPDFRFSEPDWGFLRGQLFICCLFLSEKGCILKENRHNRCLLYVCRYLEEVVPNHWVGDVSERTLLKVALDRHLDRWCRQFVREGDPLAPIIATDSFEPETISRFRQLLEKG